MVSVNNIQVHICYNYEKKGYNTTYSAHIYDEQLLQKQTDRSGSHRW